MVTQDEHQRLQRANASVAAARGFGASEVIMLTDSDDNSPCSDGKSSKRPRFEHLQQPAPQEPESAESDAYLYAAFADIVKARDAAVRQVKIDALDSFQAVCALKTEKAAAREEYLQQKQLTKEAHTAYKLAYGRLSELRVQLENAVAQHLWGDVGTDLARLLSNLNDQHPGNALLDSEKKYQLIWGWAKVCGHKGITSIWEEDRSGEPTEESASTSFESYDWSQTSSQGEA